MGAQGYGRSLDLSTVDGALQLHWCCSPAAPCLLHLAHCTLLTAASFLHLAYNTLLTACHAGDVQYLRQTGYPLMRGSASFVLEYLVEDPANNWSVTGPSNSPENGYKLDGQIFGIW